MSRFALAGTVVLLSAVFVTPVHAQARQEPSRPSIGKAMATGAIGGAAVAAMPGAAWGHQMADGANALMGAGVMAGFGAASGAATGLANALLPPRRGWKKYAQAAAVGMAVSGLAFWGFGHLNGNVGPLHPDGFRNVGLAHGAVTGAIVVRFGG